MKLVINNCYGGMTDEHKALRGNLDFIAKVEAGYEGGDEGHSGWNIGRMEHLIVVEIPDESSDYYINDYDGLESVIYVVRGAIHVLKVDAYEGQ